MKIIDGNNMLHREADVIGRGIHPVRSVFNKYCAPNQTTIIVWDCLTGNQRRKKLFPEYKGNRKPPEESKHMFFDMAKAVLRFTPVINIEAKGWEADDVIGTLCEKLHKTQNITVESNDGDFWQFSEWAYLPMVAKKWHWLSPDMLVLYKSLVGDGKDNIPGLKGFGHKTFSDLEESTKQQLLLAVKLGEYDRFKSAAQGFPKRVKIDVETFGDVCLYWKINKYMTVPDEEIDAGTYGGKLNLVAAEHFMKEYLI